MIGHCSAPSRGAKIRLDIKLGQNKVLFCTDAFNYLTMPGIWDENNSIDIYYDIEVLTKYCSIAVLTDQITIFSGSGTSESFDVFSIHFR